MILYIYIYNLSVYYTQRTNIFWDKQWRSSQGQKDGQMPSAVIPNSPILIITCTISFWLHPLIRQTQFVPQKLVQIKYGANMDMASFARRCKDARHFATFTRPWNAEVGLICTRRRHYASGNEFHRWDQLPYDFNTPKNLIRKGRKKRKRYKDK